MTPICETETAFRDKGYDPFWARSQFVFDVVAGTCDVELPPPEGKVDTGRHTRKECVGFRLLGVVCVGCSCLARRFASCYADAFGGMRQRESTKAGFGLGRSCGMLSPFYQDVLPCAL